MSASKVVLRILHVCISILVFLLVLFGLVKLGGQAYDLGYRVFTERPMENEPGTDVTVRVSEGMNALSLGTVLEEKGLVRDNKLFAIQMMLSAYAKKVKPGLYTLNTHQTSREMLKVMAAEEPKEEEEETKKEKEKSSEDSSGKKKK
ncbi:MAG: endolytic transglycosylase MltG [Lachnospiraceae bacterium]|jgi:UPF0755 protein|nr:endolytic transglycosylase MltG [Lachnospiraceae bacterium]